jgi:hypothetical protein
MSIQFSEESVVPTDASVWVAKIRSCRPAMVYPA